MKMCIFLLKIIIAAIVGGTTKTNTRIPNQQSGMSGSTYAFQFKVSTGLCKNN